MPWQEQVALVGGELDPDTGLPAYREVVVTVPRQSGKTTLILAWEIQRALGWSGPQKICYSAQTGNDARKKLIEDQLPILEPRRAKLGIRRCLRGMGNEAVEFRNGSRIILLASAEDSGHGKTLNLAVRDELFADDDDRRSQAMIPAMITVDDAQMLTASTMGTDASVPLNRVVAEGRKAVEAGERSGICYFEWSAPEAADLSDEDLWWSWMPALGHTQSPGAIRQAQRSPSMTDGEFRRAFGNVATRSEERLIPAASWDLVCGDDVAPSGRIVFGVDVDEERSAASIVAVSDTKEIELIDGTSLGGRRPVRSGVGWLVDRVAELCEKEPRSVCVYDAAGPVASLVPEFEKRRVPLVPVGSEVTKACGMFFDDVAEVRLRVHRDRAFDEAVAGARRRFVGDAWKWVRRDTSVDVTPLVAATVALWAAEVNRPKRAVDNVW